MEQSLNNFSYELFIKLFQNSTKSTAFSPYSIYVALSMVLAIAKGQSRTEILNVYHLDPEIESEAFIKELTQLISQIERQSDENGGIINGANSIWTEKDLASSLPPDSFDVLSPLEAGVNSTSFPEPGVTDINQYVKERTRNLIPRLLQPTDCPKGTFYVLVNCLYFIDRWMNPFNKSATQTQEFYGWNGISNCQLMHIKKRYPYFEDDQFQMIQLPYKTTDCTMIIALPKDKNNNNFLTNTNLNPNYLLSQQYEFCEVNVFMPKFTARTKWDKLKDGLIQTGITKIWTETCLPGGAYLSNAIQEAVVIVDEEKTEAAAATAMITRKGCCLPPSPPKLFRADHPFAYFIVHQPTNVILFMGVVTDPKTE